jgi:hypothetical protein
VNARNVRNIAWTAFVTMSKNSQKFVLSAGITQRLAHATPTKCPKVAMNEITKGPTYGSATRFPPSDDDLSIYDTEDFRDFDPFPAQFQYPNESSSQSNMTSKICKIFCACWCRNDN